MCLAASIFSEVHPPVIKISLFSKSLRYSFCLCEAINSRANWIRSLGGILPMPIASHAKRLEEDNYNTPFDGLKDWHLLRALAINRPELTTNYTHLLDQEPFDEN